MELSELFNNYSPIKFILNKNVINEIQNRNPVILDYDDVAYNNMRNKMADLFQIASNRSEFIFKIPSNFLKVFFVSFIVLFLLSDKLSILNELNQYTNEKKVRTGRVIFISILISMVFIYYFTKTNVKNIMYEMFG